MAASIFCPILLDVFCLTLLANLSGGGLISLYALFYLLPIFSAGMALPRFPWMIYLTAAVKKMLGFEPKEIVGRKHFYDLFAPEVREQLKKAAFEVFARKESFRNFINPNLHKNGGRIMLETSGTPILDEKGNLLGYRGADIDITRCGQTEEALKESEEKFRTVFEDVAEGIVVMDNKATIIEVNPKLLEFGGFTREEVIGKNIVQILPLVKADIAGILSVLKDFLRGKEVGRHEWKITNKKGEQFVICPHRSLIRKEGRIVGAVYVIEDITERKRAEEEIKSLLKETQEANEKLKKMNKTKGEFLSIVTHDLGTPLVSILGYASMLLDGMEGEIPEKQRSFLEIIKKQSLGLGLYIAKSFIEAHGGSIRAESKGLGKGSKFCFTLPL
ncbi:MAG: PAS domain S-box protein [Candidatus Margulisbacteria bacterium]|nr:PAS domain S-box protein [Candidatus Margulisiibacteriota bacterium]